jgi:hypothetical protein
MKKNTSLFILHRCQAFLLAFSLLLPTGVVGQAGSSQSTSPESGITKRASRNFDECKVPSYKLPDPLVAEDGTKITTPEQWWEKRRPEIFELMQSQMWGIAPGKPDALESRVNHRGRQGNMAYKEVIITLKEEDRRFEFPVLIMTPADAEEPVPAFIAGWNGNQTMLADTNIIMRNARLYIKGNEEGAIREAAPRNSKKEYRWPLEKIISRGYGLVHFDRQSLLVDAKTPDYNAGVYSLFPKEHEPDDWGMVAAWAWGASRIIDYLETDPDIDATRLAVKGTSRMGRMAIWTGASDQRVKMVISNVSGKGASSLLKRHFGLPSSEVVGGGKKHRYSDNLHNWAGRVDEMPFDVHYNFALIAPRALYISHAEEDVKADIRGAFLALKAAEPVYKLLGAEGLEADDVPAVNRPVLSNIGFHVRPGPHEVYRYDWECYLDFADKHLK